MLGYTIFMLMLAFVDEYEIALFCMAMAVGCSGFHCNGILVNPTDITPNYSGSVFGNYIYLFGVLHRFQHCTGHITAGNSKGRGNQYIQLVKVLYYKLPINGKQLPAFPLEVGP